MKVEDIKDPQGLVLEVETQEYPAAPGRKLTGVVAGENFVMLHGTGVTGQFLPVRSLTILQSEVSCVWASLKLFYLSPSNQYEEAMR